MSAAPPDENDPSPWSTWSHRAWFAFGCTTIALTLGKSMLVAAAASSHAVKVSLVVAGLAGYFLADLASGVSHWGLDNYGDASTPVFGPQIEAFRRHHKWPWKITRYQVANILHVLARAVGFSLLPFVLLCGDAPFLCFTASLGFFIMMSLQIHLWAHCTKSQLPLIVGALQDAGVLVSWTKHAAHHRPPYNNNYCMVSGVWNGILDKKKVFESLEMALYLLLGVRPRSWGEPGSEWTGVAVEDGEASLSRMNR